MLTLTKIKKSHFWCFIEAKYLMDVQSFPFDGGKGKNIPRSFR